MNSLDSALNGNSADECDINNLNKSGHLCDRNSSASNLSSGKYNDSYANYVNIDYFLRREETSSKNDSDDNETQMSHSISSDHEIDIREDLSRDGYGKVSVPNRDTQSTYDEVFHDPDLYGE